MKVSVMSRPELIEFTSKANDGIFALISISDVGVESDIQINSKQSIYSHLSLHFDDVSSGVENCMTAEQANQIARFVLWHKLFVDEIIITCDLGISKSSGIAAAILMHLVGDDSTIFTNPRFSPNIYCYTLVLGAFLIRIKENELERKIEINKKVLRDNGEASWGRIVTDDLDEMTNEELCIACKGADFVTRQRIQELLIEKNVGYIRVMAFRYMRLYADSCYDFDDAYQEASIGLLKAADKFDYSYECKLLTYATHYMKQEIVRSVRVTAYTIKIPLHVHELKNREKLLIKKYGEHSDKVKFDSKLSHPDGRRHISNYNLVEVVQSIYAINHMDDGFDHEELYEYTCGSNDKPIEDEAMCTLRDVLLGVLKTLTPREEKVLRLRHGFDDDRERSLEEVSKEFNVTRERIRQIEAKAFRKCRHPSRAKYLRPYLTEDIDRNRSNFTFGTVIA
jgi:RNA polymerase primary sigma factor